jgi:predicted RNA methylase
LHGNNRNTWNIKNKNFDELTARLHRGNINSLNLFTDITGLSTKTQKETEKSIRDLDPEAYDKWLEAKNLEIKKRREQEELEIMERELQKKTRYKNKIITTKEFIDQIISEGFTELSTYKKGVIPVIRLSKGAEGYEFTDKYEKKYIEKVISELKTKPVEPEKPIEAEAEPIIKHPSQSIADKVKYYLRTGISFTADRLFDIANKVYGGTQAEGKYTVKDAYDAMELAVNQHILESDYSTNVGLQDAKRNIDKLQDMLNKIPTQSKRTEEMERFQQYSTPPSIAYIANWVANVTEKDVVLEPSAGIGGLAVFAKKEGAKVIVNELSQRRLEVLKQMGFDKEFNFDAEQIDNLLPDDIKPTVVVMNPPFSSAALRMGDKTTTANAKRHIQQALNRLEDGGRLVAIVGQGMADNAPAFKEWWKEIKSKYNVRANIGIDGENYRKYGTSFDIQLVVIDKTGPTTGTTLTGKVKDLTELPKLLEGIKNDRTTTSIRQVEQDQVVPGSEKAPGQSRPNELVSPPGSRESTSNVLPKESEGSSISEPRPEAVDTETYPGQSVSVEPSESIRTDDTATGRRTDVTEPDRREVEGGQTVRTDTGYRDKSVREHEPVRSVQDTGTGVVIEKPAEDVKVEINEDDVYTAYRPKKLNVKGAHPHVTELVESAAMAAVDPPDVTYTPNLPEELITSGELSIAQLESIVYAGQAHSQVLKNGFRKGYFIGDGTGVGKGRQLAGIILDNFRQGRKKAVWISNDPKLYYDAIRDWTALGQNKNDIINLSNIEAYKPIDIESGIIYTSYATLRSSSKINPDVTRVKQIVDWLGKDFDCVIVFDESHNMSNAIEYGKGLKKSKVSKQALAGMDLQNALPNARIVYASATGATNVHNFAYLTRLGLWGEGTAFTDVIDFISKVASGGLAAMEVVARDMKSMGVYVARNLSYKGVGYETLEHELTPIQTEIYNTMSRAWQKVLQNMHVALDITGANKNGRAVGRAKAQFYGAMQRFYNLIITSMSVPSVIEDIKKELANGNAAVIQLVNTNQAATDRQIANANEEELDLDSIDLTPSDTLIEYLKKSFPVYEYEEYVDENGNKRSRIVKYNGKPVISKEAVRMRDALIEEIKEMKIPDGPLEMLFDAFGVDNVAEVTGRTSRIVPKKDEKTGEIKRVLEKRSDSHAIADAQAFQDGKKLILVFSDAGGTGKSYHADRKAKNQRKRIHYLLQPGWNAYKATQGLGRTHRSGQVTPPLFKLVTTNIMGQKRFTSTIARRLDQMGALTKGQRQAGSGVFSERDNLENPIATEALVQFYKDVIKDRTPEIGIDAKTLFTKMGLIDEFTDKHGNLVENLAIMQDMNMFLNRILALEVEEQNNVFNAFYNRFNDLFDKKLAAGEVDVGLENYKAEKIELVDEKSIWKDKNTSAETKYLQLKALQRNKILNFKFVRNFRPNFIGLVRINNTGEVRAIYRTGNKTLSSGEIVPEYILLSPDYTTSRYVQPTVESRTTPIPESEWKKAWNEQISKTPEFREETIHMLSGTLLPVWNKLPLGYTKVMRVFTADGKEYLGRIIKEEDIDITLGNFGTQRQRESYTPEDIYNKIFYDGLTAILENDKVKLERRRVSGEYRIEITGNNIWFYARNIPGIITETINYQKRYFIPIGDKAIPIIKRITDNNPVRTISKVKASNDLDSVEDTLADRLGTDDTGIPIGEIVKIVKQSITSAGTSINAVKLPVLFSKVEFKPGTVNADIGGGKYDNVTTFLATKGVLNYVYDPYNRSKDYTEFVISKIEHGQCDTVTISNVLNVIKEQKSRDEVLLNAVDAVKDNGTVYITVYEGDGTGKGKETSKGWQENRKTPTYLPEVKKYFDDVTLKNGVIIAKKPKKEMLKNIYEILRERADEAAGEDGIKLGLGLRIFNKIPDNKPGADEGEYTFTDPGMERRWQEAKNVKGPFLEELKNTLQMLWDEFKALTTRGAIPYIPRGAKYAQLRFNLLRFAKQRQVATYRTLINLKGVVSALDKNTYDLFNRKVVLEDIAEEVELKHNLAFGFAPETVKEELDRINAEIEKHPEISEALQLREQLWEAIKNEYIKAMQDIDFNVEDRFKKKHYYSHLIIDYVRNNVIRGTAKLRTPTGASYLKRREGSLKDYISDYLKGESEVMANMLYDIEKAKLIKYIKDSEHNIKGKLAERAKILNKEAFDLVLEAEAKDENVPKNHRGEGPIQATITEFNQYLAMSFNNLRELAMSGNLWSGFNGEYKDIVDNLAKGANIEDDIEFANQLYGYLAYIANTDYAGSISAKTILKYTSRKREFIKEVLGKNYKTWKDIIPDGYDIWQPREGNHLYIAYSIPENIAEQLLYDLAESVTITKNQLKELLVKGQPYEEFVLPKEVILCLDNLFKVKDEPLPSIIIKKLTNAWKQWQLISPRRVVKYNIRNLTGDLEGALNGNPKILKKTLAAIVDLHGVYFDNKPIKGDMWEWFIRGGMQSTLQVNEIDDINQLKIFVDLYNRKDKLGDKVIDLFKRYWKSARLSTDFREAILRYSAFLYALEDIENNNGKPSSYWASIKEEVDALSNKYDKAYTLSNDLIGAYDDVSILGQYLRKYAIPFYSWIEVNPKRYFRLIKNILKDDRATVNVGQRTLKILGITGVKSFSILRRIGKLILCLFGFSALTQAWNLLMYPDEEEQLPRGVRSRTHIILGRDENTGDIIYFSRLGAISDILDWVGLDTAILDVKDFLAGRLTLKEYLIQMIQSPLNKIINAAYPYHKLAFELITGRSLFPDIFRQGQIRDAGLHIAQSFGLGDEYRALTGLPKKKGSYWESLKEIFYYRTNPDEAAYWDIIDLKERYLEKEGKPHGYAFWQDKKNKALYYLKVALRYKDKEAVDKYLYEYAIYGGTAKGLKQSLNNMNPLYGLKSDELVEFVSGLSEQDKNRLVQAMQFYVDTLNPDWDSRESNMIILEPKQD